MSLHYILTLNIERNFLKQSELDHIMQVLIFSQNNKPCIRKCIFTLSTFHACRFVFLCVPILFYLVHLFVVVVFISLHDTHMLLVISSSDTIQAPFNAQMLQACSLMLTQYKPFFLLFTLSEQSLAVCSHDVWLIFCLVESHEYIMDRVTCGTESWK